VLDKYLAKLPPDEKLGDVGKLILRASIAVLMLFHGVYKVTHGIGGIQTLMAKKGLPEAFAYGVYAGEVIAPIFILLGLFSRPAALVFAFNMMVAIATGHNKDILRIGNHGEYPIELQMLYLLGAIAVALLGPGKYSLSRGKSRLG
jgi:putative oxidoreductase